MIMFVYLPSLLLCVVTTLTGRPCDSAGISTEGAISRRLEYNRTILNWYDAVTSCSVQGGHLLTLDPWTTQAGLKRRMHITEGESAWVGVYEEFDLVNISSDAFRTSTLQDDDTVCIYVMISGSTQTTTGSRDYQFTFKHQSCEHTAGLICTCNTGNSTQLISMPARRQWRHAYSKCAHMLYTGTPICKLWKASVKSTNTSSLGINAIGIGNIKLKVTRELFSIGEIFWVRMAMKRKVNVITDRAVQVNNAHHCGFLTYFDPSVLFDDCYNRKGFVCEFSSDRDNTSPTVNAELKIPWTTGPNDLTTYDDVTVDVRETPPAATHTTAKYVGIAAGVLLLVVVVVGVVLWKMKYRRAIQSKPPRISNGSRRYLPPPTVEQTTPNGQADDTSVQEANDRISLYASIDPNHEHNIFQPTNITQPIGGIGLYDVTETNADHDSYAEIQTITCSYDGGRPDRALNTGYLRMDAVASGTTDTHIDDGCYDHSGIQLSQRFASNTSDNVYGFHKTDNEDESGYDTTLPRNPNAMMPSDDYDHVTVDGRVLVHGGDIVNVPKPPTHVVLTNNTVNNPTYDKATLGGERLSIKNIVRGHPDD